MLDGEVFSLETKKNTKDLVGLFFQKWKHMPIKFLLTVLSTILLATFSAQGKERLDVYQAPGKMEHAANNNDDFTVQVREKGGSWKDLHEWKVQVDQNMQQTASMVFFDFEGEVEIKIRKNNDLIHEVAVRPASLGITPLVDGQMITFSLNKPANLSIEVNNDKLRNLHLFANAIFEEKILPNDTNVIYFGPGIHYPSEQENGVYKIPSGKTVFLHGGAVVCGKFLVDKAENVQIVGRGIVWQPTQGVEIRHSKNVHIEGLIFINPSHYTICGGETSGLTIKGIKSFSNKIWADGIDLMSCSDVKIDGVFMRNSDDCIAIYGHRWNFFGNAQNYKITNATLWADVAHTIHIGMHGNAKLGGDTLENMLFENIDILEHDENSRAYQGCLAISCGDNNLIQDITFRNIRIDDIQEGQLFNFRIVFDDTFSHAPGRKIKNILLENIFYRGALPNPSIIKGYNDERSVDNIWIKNLQVNGQKVTTAGDLISAEKHVEGFIIE